MSPLLSCSGLIIVVILGVLGQIKLSHQQAALHSPPSGGDDDDDAIGLPRPSPTPTEAPASAEPLLGTMVMPAVPQSFPLVEFTDYGVQGQLMPSARQRHGARPHVENRFGYNARVPPVGGRRTHGGSVIPGSVPVNTYHNPTTGLAEIRNGKISNRPRVTHGGSGSSPYAGGASWDHGTGGGGGGGGGGGSLIKSTGYGSIRRESNSAGYGGVIDRSNPIDYFDYREESEEEGIDDVHGISGGYDLNDEGQGTLHAALQTLWEHRNEAYHNFGVQDTPSPKDSWVNTKQKEYRPSYDETSNRNHGKRPPLVNPLQRARPSEYPLRTKTGEILQLGFASGHPRPVNHNRNNPFSRRQQAPGGGYPSGGFTTHRPSGGYPNGFFTTKRPSGGYHGSILTTPRPNEPRQRPPNNSGPRRPTRTQVAARVVTKRPFEGGGGVVSQAHHQKGMPGGRRSGIQSVMIQRLGSSTLRGPGPGRHTVFNSRPVKGHRPLQMVRSRFPVDRIGTATMGDSGVVLPTTNTDEKQEEPLYITGISYEDYDTEELPDFTGFPNYDVAGVGQGGSSGPAMVSGATGTQLRNQALQNPGNLETDAAFEKSDWMTQVSDVMSGVSNQLPSIEKAVTTMSFMAFGIFMANLLLQAVVNSSFTSFLGRTDKSDDSGNFVLDLANLPIDLDLEEFDFDSGRWKESLEGDEGSLSSVKKLLKVMGQVYVSLHEIARAGVYNVVSALGLSPRTRRTPEGAEDLAPECLRRLLCEGHHVTAPYFKDASSYRLLPFWTLGASWLSGNSNMPRLLEELRAEVAGQQGLPCEALFPDCNDTEVVDGFLEKIRRGMADIREGEGEEGPLPPSDGVSGRVLVDAALESSGVQEEEEEEDDDPDVLSPNNETDSHGDQTTMAPMLLRGTESPLLDLNLKEEEKEEEEKEEEEEEEEEEEKEEKKQEEEGNISELP
ncbi:LOW QUALITY PROTEIN: uncharacterized protein LOC135226405 [Macrobrachium nipponense]|uniref:LOW QUALITY PROTEIN: uncharacterized protein LOC135226405 n=1 Tax=Macrobrachium nipponense TaxID=159736 RepID=UPI0030C7B014